MQEPMGEGFRRTAIFVRALSGPGRSPSSRVVWVVLAVLLVSLALATCGKKGPPVEPQRRLPATVQDLAAAIVGDGVRLTWTLPKIRVDRSQLKEVRRTEVYRRLETSEQAEPPRPAILTFGGLFGEPSTVAGFERVADIMVAEPTPAEVRGGRVTYVDTQGLAFGQRYTYVVVAIDEQGRPSPPSNRVAVALTAPPKPPTRVVTEPGDGQVRLRWEPPASLEDGAAAPETLIYDVFRTTDPGARASGPLTPEPVSTPQYVDLTVQNDTTYYYSVRARLGPGGPTSRPSEVAAATPEDTTPPSQPRGLVAVVAGRTARLAWEAVPDPDLAGYHVYRSPTAGRGYVKLTPTPQPSTTYVDSDVRVGQTYYYVVTAVDRSRRANESVPSPEASVTLR